MKRQNNSAANNDSATNIPSIDYADIILYAPHSKEHPQTVNDKGFVTKGTSLVSFMGYKHTMIEWIDIKGKEQQVPKIALVFAVKLSNGSFKKIPVKLPYAVAPGTNLEIALKAMGINPEYQTIQQDPDDDLFGTITTVNLDKLETDMGAVKGLAFLVVIENMQNPKTKRYYNDIDLSTLTPRLDKAGVQMRIAPVEKCDVSDVNINFNDD